MSYSKSRDKDGTLLCPKMLCNIDCKGIVDGCRYAHPANFHDKTAKHKVLCKFHSIGCKDQYCPRLHMHLNVAYDMGEYRSYLGRNQIVNKIEYKRLLEKKREYNDLYDKYDNLKDKYDSLKDKYDNLKNKNSDYRKTSDGFLLTNITLKNTIQKLEEQIQKLEESINIKNARITHLEESITTYESEQNTKKRKLQMEPPINYHNQDYNQDYNQEHNDDIRYRELYEKNQQIIACKTYIDQLIEENRVLCEQIGYYCAAASS